MRRYVSAALLLTMASALPATVWAQGSDDRGDMHLLFDVEGRGMTLKHAKTYRHAAPHHERETLLAIRKTVMVGLSLYRKIEAFPALARRGSEAVLPRDFAELANRNIAWRALGQSIDLPLGKAVTRGFSFEDQSCIAWELPFSATKSGEDDAVLFSFYCDSRRIDPTAVLHVMYAIGYRGLVEPR